MSRHFDPAAYFPDRPPTWVEIGISLLVASVLVLDLLGPKTLSWPAVAVGFVAFAVALGPASRTALGERIGQWFRGIGVTGRAIVIVLFAVAVTVAAAVAPAPSALLSDAATGGLLAVLCYMVAFVILAREVSGWTPETDRRG